jgi:hypothetical protein
VQDLPEEYFEKAIEFIIKFYIPDETFCMCKDLPNKPKAIKSYAEFFRNALKQKLSIACFKNDGSDELIGENIFIVRSKDDPKNDIIVRLKIQF